MIRVKVNTSHYVWNQNVMLGHCLHVSRRSNILLYNIYNYDTIIVNHAHNEPNISVFAALCKQKGKQILISGLVNQYTKDLIDIADEYEKFNHTPN